VTAISCSGGVSAVSCSGGVTAVALPSQEEYQIEGGVTAINPSEIYHELTASLQHSATFVCISLLHPTQSMIYVHCLVARFENIIFFIVQYKYQKSCEEDQMLQDVILHTRLCSTSFITQPG